MARPRIILSPDQVVEVETLAADRLTTVILAAPDIDAEIFKRRIAPRLSSRWKRSRRS